MKLKVLAAAILFLAVSGLNAEAGPIINFVELPNEGGIEVSGFDASGNPFGVITKLGSETFHISSPAVPGGYSPDAILSHIGISRTSAGYLVNILESPGGPISDQVYVYQFIPAFTVIDFISDPSQFFTGVPNFTVVETGGLQNVLNYFNDRGELVSINVQSNVDAVPEPGSLALAGMGIFGLAAYGRRRRAKVAV